ncbi:hypothetical protein KUTeg_022061 [Tegillarca granosa]|uniref:Uncharacterized protein n=1 Tax=Tegillarca granosa TaxID=220873 RepID=A0ABQ9E9I5_TEGGR|nr:hypothetical protein KUTeg_022061 [Tegillarca granosa]
MRAAINRYFQDNNIKVDIVNDTKFKSCNRVLFQEVLKSTINSLLILLRQWFGICNFYPPNSGKKFQGGLYSDDFHRDKWMYATGGDL